MKYRNLIPCVLSLALCLPAFAGQGADKAGNGGGTWVCKNKDRLRTIRWIELVDLYEGRNEFDLTIPKTESRGYLEIAEEIMTRRLLPVSENLHNAVKSQLEIVKKNIVIKSQKVERIDDALFRLSPNSDECPNGAISYVQLANFTAYGKILVQKNIFENPRLGETDKAALLIHEAVYAHFREKLGDENSVRTRRLVGLLFSTLDEGDLRKTVAELLGGLSAFGMEFVRISPEYEMQTTVVTQKQYFDLMGTNPSYFSSQYHCPETFRAVLGVTLCPNHPVEQVLNANESEYYDVGNETDTIQAFLARLNATRHDGYFYRLPTEAEWEFAARAGAGTKYPYGDDESQLALDAWTYENAAGQTHAVAQLRPNAFGLYDMYGNVMQVVQEASEDEAVSRGCSWMLGSQDCRIDRAAGPENELRRGSQTDGFRLVRVKIK